ncbi:MAG: OadG family protein [Synergistota bacterium]|nr:OadG family protein [Synergistota bacterium]
METTAVNGAVEAVETAGRAAESLSGVSDALIMCIIAFSVVFLVLVGLTGVIFAIKYMAQGLERKKGGPTSGATSTPSAAGSPAQSPASDGRLLAVITAAVAATGINGRITSIQPGGGTCLRHIRSSGWRNATLSEGIQTLRRGWK